MKQNDIALIILIVFISGVSSFFISNAVIGSSEKDLKAAKVEPINDNFDPPSDQYFNEKSINPTQIIRIDPNKNQNPLDEE